MAKPRTEHERTDDDRTSDEREAHGRERDGRERETPEPKTHGRDGDTELADEPHRRESSDTADDDPAPGGVGGAVSKVVATVFELKPVRVFFHYLSRIGPLMATGLAYQALFATFAALWVGFSIAGIVIQNDIGLRNSLVDTISDAVPGLIASPGQDNGAIDPQRLLETGGLNWTGLAALVILLFIALNFLASARDAVRRMFGLQQVQANILLLKARDLGLALAFGAALLLSTVLSSISTVLMDFFLALVGIGSDSWFSATLGTVIGLLIVLALDTAVLAALYRVLAGIPIPRLRLLGGALLGGVLLGTLKLLGNTLLGGAGTNPLLASFAIIIGLLIFFNLICQAILISAAWVAVGMNDSGIAADPAAAEAERREQERIAELERIAAEAQRPKGLARVWAQISRRSSK